MISTEAMGIMRDGPVARFCGRLFLMLKSQVFLIIDRCDITHFGRMESRSHTPAHIILSKTGAVLKGNKETLSIAYDCNVPATLRNAIAMTTSPGPDRCFQDT